MGDWRDRLSAERTEPRGVCHGGRRGELDGLRRRRRPSFDPVGWRDREHLADVHALRLPGEFLDSLSCGWVDECCAPLFRPCCCWREALPRVLTARAAGRHRCYSRYRGSF